MNQTLINRILTLVFEYITTKDKAKRTEARMFIENLAHKVGVPLNGNNRKDLKEAYKDFINKPLKDSLSVLYSSL